AVLSITEMGEGLPYRSLVVKAGGLRSNWVDENPRPRRIHREVHRRIVIIQGTVPRLTFPQQRLRVFAFGDVDVDADDALWFSIAVIGNDTTRFDPMDLSTGANNPVVSIICPALVAEG